VHYIAHDDVTDGKEYKGILLQKDPGRVHSEETTLVPNPADEACICRGRYCLQTPSDKEWWWFIQTQWTSRFQVQLGQVALEVASEAQALKTKLKVH